MDLLVAHSGLYPLAPGGGVFLSIVGVAMLVGAVRFPARNVLLGAGAALATIATAMLAPGLAARIGAPTIAQIAWLAVAVAAEIVLLRVFVRRAWPRGERAVVLTILGIVGVHFLPMAPAFGPPMLLLAVLCVANALLAVRLREYPLPAVWAVDGGLKFAIGVCLLWPAVL